MQTKAQLQQLLISAGVTPNKRFGQNFLIDLNLMQLLINSVNIQKTDTILEVGCGTGSLTEELSKKAAAVISVEIDTVLYKIALSQLQEKQNVQLINDDILKNKHTVNTNVIDPVKKNLEANKGRFLLIANLPYNIASPLMINLATQPPFVDAMYVTVQREVAERMIARPSDRHYGIISIILSSAGDLKLIKTLKPSCFWPAPQVDSAMVSFVRNEEKFNKIKNVSLFSETVNMFMQHRRKMLKACTKFASGNLLQVQNWPEIFEKSNIDSTKRPEQISPEGFLAIANLCGKTI